MNYKIVEGKKGFLTLLIDSKFFHSVYDPQKEAILFLKKYGDLSDSFVFLPFVGLGYVLNEIVKFNKIKVVVLDPFNLIQKNPVLKDVLKKQNIWIIKSENDIKTNFDLFFEDFSSYKNYVEIKDNKILEFLKNDKVYKNLYEFYKRKLDEFLSFNITVKNFWELWLYNAKKNLKKIKHFKDVFLLKNSFANKKILITGGGFSLDEEIEKIKKVRKNFVLVASDTSVKTLVYNGIIPDFICGIDPQSDSLKHYTDIEEKIKDIPFISEILCSPEVLEKFKNVYMFSCYYPFLKEKLNFYFLKRKGGSVVNAVCNLLYEFKAKTIFFSGCEFCFYKNLTHTKGSFYFEDEYKKTSKFENVLTMEYKKVIFLNDYIRFKGKKWKTSKNLLLYKNELKFLKEKGFLKNLSSLN